MDEVRHRSRRHAHGHRRGHLPETAGVRLPGLVHRHEMVLLLVHRRRGGRAHAQVTRSGHCISVAVGLSVGLSVGLAVNNWGAPIVVVQPRERGGLVLAELFLESTLHQALNDVVVVRGPVVCLLSDLSEPLPLLGVDHAVLWLVQHLENLALLLCGDAEALARVVQLLLVENAVGVLVELVEHCHPLLAALAGVGRDQIEPCRDDRKDNLCACKDDPDHVHPADAGGLVTLRGGAARYKVDRDVGEKHGGTERGPRARERRRNEENAESDEGDEEHRRDDAGEVRARGSF
mmetsp:Transcript_54440/g.128450  ORF Transcript_54440/g.128450 Transcript_54440/m.128450 type:complete len:291 (+) Transcript_54440:534-1406(+)